MSEHTIGTREEWQAARDELAKAENEHAERSEELAKRRRGSAPTMPSEPARAARTWRITSTRPSST